MSEGSEMTPASPATQTHDELIQAAVTDAENLETMVKKGGVSQEIIDAVVKTADAVRKASQKKVVVSIAVKTKSLDGRQRRINIRMNTIACAICVAAGLLVLNDWLIRNDHICFHTPIPDKVAFVPIGLVILFLLFLLVTVVLRGSREEKHMKFLYIPDR